MTYKPVDFENKWIKKWTEQDLYSVREEKMKKKLYLLVEFPYPSGERLHVGHARSYCCLDAVARKKRMQGWNVLYPMGWDAFGLPAENYAVKTGIHPAITTKENIDNAKKQAISWGLSFDWNREINTTDPEYYRWTQWIFIKLFKKGLAYKEEIPVNWCPSCKIILANEEVIDGKCERCGAQTERRKQSQWLLRITKYADRLIDDLKSVNFREDIAAAQVNWIGRKTGARVRFKIYDSKFKNKELEVFTTRLDTLFGVTFVVVAPEHAWVQEILNSKHEIPNTSQIQNYVKQALNRSERERKQKTEKTGVDTGIKAINPASGEEVPVYIADYVMMDVGTGVVMGVPAHDERDFEFADKYHLGVTRVIEGGEEGQVYTGEGRLVNSGKYNGMESNKAAEKMIADGLGEPAVNYHLRDWVFSRQHYWGEPIPMVNCPKDGWVPVPEDQLPVRLPEIEKFQPTDTGESPLAHIGMFVNTTCPKCGGPARRETDTMPNWAGSSWYYLRYCDPNNKQCLADKQKLEYWLPVDWYNGGMEHTTLHLMYSRFWHKFLFEQGLVPTSEPYAKRTSHGMILGSDSRKMSKSRGNVVNPDEVVGKFGADTLRMYEMFIGPFDQMTVWSWEGVEGVYRFLKRVWVLVTKPGLAEKSSDSAVERVNKLIIKTDADLDNLKFNTAVAALMEFVNWWGQHQSEVGRVEIINFIKILAPMAPFIAEEVYQRLVGETDKWQSVHSQTWPTVRPVKLDQNRAVVIVQVDGKLRDKLEMTVGDAGDQQAVERAALAGEKIGKFVTGKKYRVVFVAGKLINLVTGNG